MEEYPNKPTPKAKKKERKAKGQALTTIKTWDVYQVKMKPNTRGVAASTHHQALHMCALWHEVTKAHPLVRVIMMMRCLLMIKLCKIMLNLLSFALANKRK